MKNNKTIVEAYSTCAQLNLDFIENRIYSLRNTQVMIDIDLADLYGVDNRSLKQSVRRNINKFPDDFLFKLTQEEANQLISIGVSQNVIPPGYNTGGSEMFAFTEHGVAMLASVLKSQNATIISVAIIRAFIAMRHFILSNAQVFQRLDRIEHKLLETENSIGELFNRIDERSITPSQGLFYNGQIFDAYKFICDLIKTARSRIILIDNYVDDTVLTMLDKRSDGIPATIYTQTLSDQLKLDLTKHNEQYPAIDVHIFKKSHDRFLIIDDSVYLVGASLKDVGKKWFGVTKMSAIDPNEMIARLGEGLPGLRCKVMK